MFTDETVQRRLLLITLILFSCLIKIVSGLKDMKSIESQGAAVT